ncbi:hypothetical protein QE152_g13269 [Popillia japonica]|uniref:Transposase n=1 Tax=Popillia japonica TaxID=7064 RepID=A0AAW1LEQ9_POPJA
MTLKSIANTFRWKTGLLRRLVEERRCTNDVKIDSEYLPMENRPAKAVSGGKKMWVSVTDVLPLSKDKFNISQL